MEKFIPYEKMSKKARRVLDLQKRSTWGGIDPATRQAENKKAYKRHPKHRAAWSAADREERHERPQ